MKHNDWNCLIGMGSLLLLAVGCGNSAPMKSVNSQKREAETALKCDWQKAQTNEKSSIRPKNLRLNQRKFSPGETLRLDFDLQDDLKGICLGYPVQHMELTPFDQVATGIPLAQRHDTWDSWPAVLGDNTSKHYYIEIKIGNHAPDRKTFEEKPSAFAPMPGSYAITILNIYGLDANAQDIQHVDFSVEEAKNLVIEID